MNLTALDWELTEGLELRRKEAEALAAREHLVRELRAARHAVDPDDPTSAAGRAHWWTRLLGR